MDDRITAAVVGVLTVAIGIAASPTLAAQPRSENATYERWCERCHGTDGSGNGPAAATLRFNDRAPRDFTTGVFRYRTTTEETSASDADLRRTIRNGLAETAMPAFAGILSDAQIEEAITTLRGFHLKPTTAPIALTIGEPPTPDARVLESGRRIYSALGCQRCHGLDGTGALVDSAIGEHTGVPAFMFAPASFTPPHLTNDDGSVAVATDLTRPWGFRGGSEAEDIVMRLAAGISGTPMRGYARSARMEELWALAYYVRSLAAAPSLREAAIAAALRPHGLDQEPRDYGEYLAKSGTCFLCHVQMQPDGSYSSASFGAGGMRVRIKYIGTQYSRNLTSEPATGIGGWFASDFRRAIKRGRAKDGRRLNPLDMPWTILTGLADSDADALYAYFSALEPVDNQIPAPRAPGLVEGVIEKGRALITGSHEGAFFRFHPGNAGSALSADGVDIANTPTAARRNVHNPTTGLLLLAASMLASAALLGLRLGRPGRRRPTPPPRRIAVGVWIAAMFTATAVYNWPFLMWMPTGLLLGEGLYGPAATALNLPPLRQPPPPLDSRDPGLEALARRGREVATTGTCSLCHTAGPSWIRLWSPFPELGGGMKANWEVYGTTYSRNITPDTETGIGAWSDAEIKRAVTTGLSRDGRTMHWQAMPWDHFSRLKSEDLEALVFYLRSIPAAFSKIPPPAPPDNDDMTGDSFWLGYSGEYRIGSE